MSVEEFNTKYSKYLSPGHYGLDINNLEVIVWLDKLFENYLTKHEGFVYYQIKTKYNTVRFYSSLSGDIITAALVDMIEETIKGMLDRAY